MAFELGSRIFLTNDLIIAVLVMKGKLLHPITGFNVIELIVQDSEEVQSITITSITALVYVYNCTRCKVTGYSPFYFLIIS